MVKVDATRTDFRHPSNGTYLRVDWTDTPGDSPEAAWREQAASFAATHAGYEEVRIESTEFKGFEAAEWEFLYDEGGARLHAVDLGFVTGDRGYALNFQTRASSWEDEQDLFEDLKDSFGVER